MAQENQVVCGSCGGSNRLPSACNAGDAKCGSKLFSGHPDVDARIFDHQITRSSLPVVDVWAPRCCPCKMMALAHEAAATESGATGQIVRWVGNHLPMAAT
ncbi:thioredoxin domain-containing protein [Mesorhizobium sp. STM 4661]|uniref:thioredoxin domain-containing protein n=1 Tax=Mesorhizobium sp. STM 4661 TaxID=1297570 RepID=UPI00068636ED|nr:thioredoxin domain-containing protein [Mesorhizobium sp. STM 4661]